MKKYFQDLKQRPQMAKKVKMVYITAFFYVFTTISTIFLKINIMMQFGSSFTLGLITSVFAVFSILMLFFLKRFTKLGKRDWLFISVSAFLVLGVIAFVIWPNFATLLIYNLGLVICDVIVATLFDMFRNKDIKESGLYDDIAEHQCVIESIFQITRIVSFAILVLLGALRSFVALQVFFIVCVAIFAVAPIILLIYEKKFKE